MAFQRLNILAKKKSSGLHSSSNVDSCYPPSNSSASGNDSPTHSHGSHDLDEPDLDDFGAKLERCKGPELKESLSKRNKLFGSLRSLRSMSPLYLSPGKTRRNDTDRSESLTKYTEPCSTPLPISPSLSLLRFEQSPADKPILELNLNQRSFSEFSTKVQHSSPLAVPNSAKQTTYDLFPSLPAGTIPVTPGPMQRAFNRDTAKCNSWQTDSPMPTETHAPLTPVLTPLPGTNLSVEDIDPEFIPLSPSLNPSTVHLDPAEPGYFDILIDEQPPIDNLEALEGSGRPLANDDHGPFVDNGDMSAGDVDIHLYANCCNDTGDERHQLTHSNVSPRTIALDVQHHGLNRKQGAGDISGSVLALDILQHHHTLPFRPRHNAEQHCVRKDSVVNKDCETCNDKSCAEPTSAQIQGPLENSSSSVATTDAVPVESRDSGDPARRKIWGGNIGLYDGSGYGGDSSGPATPYEPDEGIKGVHILFNPRTIDALPAARSLNRTNCEMDATLPDHDCDSLESMYRVYAFLPGDAISDSRSGGSGSSSSSSSTEANMQPAS